MEPQSNPIADLKARIAQLEDRLRCEQLRADQAEASARLAWRLATWGGGRRQGTPPAGNHGQP